VSRAVPLSRPSFSAILVSFSSPTDPYERARMRGIEHAVVKHPAIVEIDQAFAEPLDEAGLRLARSPYFTPPAS